MPIYTCGRCLKDFTQKSHYVRHLNRKNPCKDNKSNLDKIIKMSIRKELSTLKNELMNEIDKKIGINNNKMNTFVDLYNYLKNLNESDIKTWLQKPWKGKDKQESLLRLFAGLGLITKLNKDYAVCKGNFNNKTLTLLNNYSEIFYNSDNEEIKLKDSGDSSDLSCKHKTDNDRLICISSKCLSKENIGDLDIEKMSFHAKKYLDKKISYGFAVKNKKETDEMVNRSKKSSSELKKVYDSVDTIVIDWDDLNEAYHQFKDIYSDKSIDDIKNNNKEPLVLRMHQKYSVSKTIQMKSDGKERILWGHIQRSGKSYIIGGSIIEDSKNKDGCNYLIITTAPNETITQYLNVFNHSQFNDFNTIYLNGKTRKPKLTNKNIIVCSKQFLQNKIDETKKSKSKKKLEEKTRSIKWLKDMMFDMRFLDESHNGGTTELAQKTLKYYGNNTFTVQITATYTKPVNDYSIPRDCWILWDLEDIKLCKNIDSKNNAKLLIDKHGDIFSKIMNTYSAENIMNEYQKFPDLFILTDEIKPEIKKEILEETKDNNYGWSPDACFLLKQNKDGVISQFQNPEANLDIWYKIFGKKNKFGSPDSKYPDDIVFMERIKKICQNPEYNSRYIDDDDNISVIMAFLPQNNIDKISKATKNLLEKNNVIPQYEIIYINSKSNGGVNPKQLIENAKIVARNSNKKGILVLSGRQCSLGITIHDCDIVLLLNNTQGFDMIYQMMFRCMTEGKNKKCGFVVDLNIQRVIETSLIKYSSIIKPKEHPRDACKYLLQERIINLNADHWVSSFGHNNEMINTITKNIYDIYSSKAERVLSHWLNRLHFKNVILNNNEQMMFNKIFKISKSPTKKQMIEIEKLLEIVNSEDNIKEGIEKKKIDDNKSSEDESNDSDISDSEEENKTEEKKVNIMDLYKHIIPLICLLTIHDDDTSFVNMVNLIKQDQYKLKILVDQTRCWWGNKINIDIIEVFINMYIKYMNKDMEIEQIIRTVKELFSKNVNNSEELSKLIDKYLIPEELEKKKNAEVSTPRKLRQEMLDKIPKNFWKKPQKVFEPCSGKGGFVIDIIGRFMEGLKNKIPDEKKRYRTIVEDCLYWADINPTNIFICKLLIDPFNEYKLNYNEGNTLEIDIKEKWGLDGFNAVIGNPPYNKGKNSNFYVYFIKYAYKYLKNNGFLLYVIPNRFLIPYHSANKNIRFFKVLYINHTVSDFNVSTDIGYFLAEKNINNDNSKIKTLFKNNIIDYINLDHPTPSANNDIRYKKLSDKIILNKKKLLFIKDKKENMDDEKYIFIPRHWTRFCFSKKKGGKHVFQILDIFGDDGRYIKVNKKNKKNIIWYLTRSKIIRFITNNYASSVFIPPFIWKNIPIINFDERYDDNNLYKIFKLTPTEINFIEKCVD